MMTLSNFNRHTPVAANNEGNEAVPESISISPEVATADLIDKFSRNFSFRVALTDEDKEKAYALRYEVFIEELDYKMSTLGDRHLEVDEYDGSSAQCLLIHNDSNSVAGCFRIVSPTSLAEGGPCLLPVEKHGRQGISHASLHPEMMPRDKVCEASRLAICQRFRHQMGGNGGTVSKTVFDSPANRLILPSLFLAAYSLAELLGNCHLYAMMAPTLPRLLKKSGFNFVKLGDTIEFHGRRNVFYINRDLADSGMQHELAPLHHHIYHQIEPQAARYLALKNHPVTPQ